MARSVAVYKASTGALDRLEEEAGFQACSGAVLLPEPAKPGSVDTFVRGNTNYRGDLQRLWPGSLILVKLKTRDMKQQKSDCRKFISK